MTARVSTPAPLDRPALTPAERKHARGWFLASSPFRTDAEEAEMVRLVSELKADGDPLPFEPVAREGTARAHAFALDPLREVLHVARLQYLEVEDGLRIAGDPRPDLSPFCKTSVGRWDLSDGSVDVWVYFDREPTREDLDAIGAMAGCTVPSRLVHLEHGWATHPSRVDTYEKFSIGGEPSPTSIVATMGEPAGRLEYFLDGKPFAPGGDQ